MGGETTETGGVCFVRSVLIRVRGMEREST